MRYLYATAIDGGLAEDNELFAHLIVFVDILRSTEPHEIHHAHAVGGMAHDTLLSRSHLILFIAQDACPYLHKRHVGRQLAYGVDVAAVNILVWEIGEKVTPRLYAELLAEKLFLVWTYARKVHYVLIEN